MASRLTTKVLVVLALALGTLAGGPGSAAAQGPGIPELRRLLGERETDITRLEAQLRTQEQRADSLSRAKRGTTSCGSAPRMALFDSSTKPPAGIAGLAAVKSVGRR